MSEQHIIRHVERLAASVPTPEAPIGALLAAGERRRRRQASARVTVAAAAAVLLVVGLVASLAGGKSDDSLVPVVEPSSSRPEDSTAVPVLDGTWVVKLLLAPSGRDVYRDTGGIGTVQLTFDAGRLTGTTGCNTIFGRYVQEGSDLTFPPAELGSTEVGCEDEPPLVQRLKAVRHLSRPPGGFEVYLHDERSMIMGVLVRIEDLGREPDVESESGAPDSGTGSVIPTDDSNTTARDLCQTPVIAFEATQEPEAERAASPEAAVRPWLTAGQEVQSVGPDGNGNRYVKVGAAAGEPAAVHLVEPTDSGWVIRRTVVCLVEAPDDDGCGAVIDAPDGIRWTIEPADPPGLGIGVGGVWQQGRIPSCARFDVDGKTGLGLRASVAPVTLFTAQEMARDEELTVSIVHADVRKLHP